METVLELVNNNLEYLLPVSGVAILIVLVYAFGFKRTEQPPFDKLSSGSNDEKKTAGKKKKIKEKVSVETVLGCMLFDKPYVGVSDRMTFLTENCQRARCKRSR